MLTIPQEVLGLAAAIAAAAAVVAIWVLVVATLDWLRQQRQWQAAQVFVRAADRMLAESTGKAKLAWVTTQLSAMFPKLDSTRMRALIEAALDVKRGGAQ